VWVVYLHPDLGLDNAVNVLVKTLNVCLRDRTKRVDLVGVGVAYDGTTVMEAAIGEPAEKDQPLLGRRYFIDGANDRLVRSDVLNLWVCH
jgi:hypothetical protein